MAKNKCRKPVTDNSNQKLNNKRVLKTISIVVGVLLTLFVLVVCSGEVSYTSTKIENAQSASNIDENTYKPLDFISTFAVDSPMIFVTATINNAPEDTVIKAVWIYNENDYIIAQVELELTEVNQNVVFDLSKPIDGFPTGKYEVKLYIDDEYDKSVKFEVN